ncbi:MAG: drrA 2 [Gammaproteobacteria bacterium]|jgi:ABC-2 type transport system ATP-binding protein|nr:drrA 2 [Gammaproteobacteria bacterium]
MTSALLISDLRKTYGNGVEALKGISFEVAEGDFYALLGPNGAGKTTAIGIITSLVNKTSGHISIFGHDLNKESRKAKALIGLVPQEFNFSVFEKVLSIVVTQAGYYGIPASVAKPRAEKILKQLGLWDKRDSAARSLSGGMKRRLMIARALIHEPKLLILDEPTAGVDIELRRSMWQFLTDINSQGVTVILTTHYLEEAEHLCRNIGVINKGKLIENTSMGNLLRRLNVETFICYLSNEIAALPELPDFNPVLVDNKTLQVDIQKGKTLNDLYAALSQAGIQVASMRNKVNRLEEMFLRLVATDA